MRGSHSRTDITSLAIEALQGSASNNTDPPTASTPTNGPSPPSSQHFVKGRKVRLDPRLVTVAPRSVVKFSPSQYSLATHAAVKLATAEQYREVEGDGVGIKGPDDAVHRESLRGYLDRWNPSALRSLPGSDKISGTVMYQSDSSWLFCTSLPPRSLSDRRALEADFDADCMTDVSDTAAFARELGSAVAHMSPGPPQCHTTTNSIESLWALFKRGYVGTYHQMSRKHLDRYLVEFTARHNARQYAPMRRLEALAAGCDGKRLDWATLTA